MLSCTDVVPRFFQLFLECAHFKVTIVPKRDAQIAIDSADLVLGIHPLDRSQAVTRPYSVRANLLEDARPFRFLSFDWEELTPGPSPASVSNLTAISTSLSGSLSSST